MAEKRQINVFVLNKDGKPLMPCSPRKARILVKNGKASVVSRLPYTIRLNYGTRGHTQKLTLGVDTGNQNIGIALVSGNRVMVKLEILLRKSMEKKVLLNTRKEYRRGRRYRKTRYRHPKFRHRTVRRFLYDEKTGRYRWMKAKASFESPRPEGWLPPSIQSKADHHINWIRKFLNVMPVHTELVIETAKFDVQHMKDPDIRGDIYQKGRMYGYENVRSYVLAKFDYTCPVCGHKFDKDHKPRMHHISMKKNGASDNPDELAPVCEKCHTAENHMNGAVLDRLRKKLKRKEYREPAFMNTLRLRLFKAFPDAGFTYGNITSADRKSLGLPKTHANDAVAIAFHDQVLSGSVTKGNLEDHVPVLSVRQVRKKKRSLYEANPRKGRKEPNRTAKRNPKNTKQVTAKGTQYFLYDEVECFGKRGFITGFTGTSGAYIQDMDGNYITIPDKVYKQVPLSGLKIKKHNNNWICEMDMDIPA